MVNGDSLKGRCVVLRLGRVGYREAYDLQRNIHAWRVNAKVPDVLLLLEHLPTYTIGRSGDSRNILISEEELGQRGISVVFTDRAGDVTYHGPGQLVGYPIIDLSQRGKDIHRYVRDLEEVLIRTLSDFGINSQRDRTHAGVWVEEQEIAAIGLSIRRWVSMHGFALNIAPNLEHFAFINPCGFTDRCATSVCKILNRDVTLGEAIEKLIPHLAEVFGLTVEFGSTEWIRSQGRTKDLLPG